MADYTVKLTGNAAVDKELVRALGTYMVREMSHDNNFEAISAEANKSITFTNVAQRHQRWLEATEILAKDKPGFTAESRFENSFTDNEIVYSTKLMDIVFPPKANAKMAQAKDTRTEAEGDKKNLLNKVSDFISEKWDSIKEFFSDIKDKFLGDSSKEEQVAAQATQQQNIPVTG